MDAEGLSRCSPQTDCDVDSFFKNQSGGNPTFSPIQQLS